MSSKKISVVMTVFNEEKRIKDCLESIKWADEIIIVDNSSTDRTVEIAKRYTKNLFNKENDPLHIDLQKNFGIQKATGNWILLIDADEVVTKALAAEIKEVINYNEVSLMESSTQGINGFWIPRKNIIFGKWIENTGWYPDHQLRLFKKGKGNFKEENLHQPIQIEGQTEKLTEHIIHENYSSISQFIQKLDTYTTVTAIQKASDNEKFTWTSLLLEPVEEFLSRYFLRKGYKDGLHGLTLSLLMAFYEFIIWLKIWEKKGFEEVSTNDVSKGLEATSSSIKKKLNYWFYEKRITEESMTFKKQVYKLRRRIGL